MKKSVIATAIAAAVVLGGAGTAVAMTANQAPAPEPTSSAVTSAVTETPAAVAPSAEPTTEATSEPAVDLTAHGEICNPEYGNDFPCALAAPDLAVINMTAAPRASSPLSDMTPDERVALAHKACDAMEAGGTVDSVILVETPASVTANNNFALFSAARISYCPDYAEQWEKDALEKFKTQ